MDVQQFESELAQLAVSSFEEFADLADYIWKSPNLIDSETKIELEKLDAYFPLKGDPKQDEMAERLRKMRWHHERRKLQHVFPYVMANGNLFTCISVFETYCLMVCKAIEKHAGLSFSEFRGSGISKCFNYMSSGKIDLARTAFRRQVQVAILVRNCLFHANGVLEWSRDEKELRRLIAAREYLSDNLRVEPSHDELGQVAITASKLGSRLQISNGYAHDVCYYVQCHFVDLCKLAQIAYAKNCTINLPYHSALR
jgi:hypothetical protein